MKFTDKQIEYLKECLDFHYTENCLTRKDEIIQVNAECCVKLNHISELESLADDPMGIGK